MFKSDNVAMKDRHQTSYKRNLNELEYKNGNNRNSNQSVNHGHHHVNGKENRASDMFHVNSKYHLSNLNAAIHNNSVHVISQHTPSHQNQHHTSSKNHHHNQSSVTSNISYQNTYAGEYFEKLTKRSMQGDTNRSSLTNQNEYH